MTTSTYGPLTLEALKSWLETKDPNEGYDYESITHCLIAQFARAQGYEPTFTSPSSIFTLETGYVNYPIELNEVALRCRPRTFGGALEYINKEIENGKEEEEATPTDAGQSGKVAQEPGSDD